MLKTINKLFVLIIVSLLLACFLKWYVHHLFESCMVQGSSPTLKINEVKRLMKYHGTNSAWLDEDGEWKFKRDKVVCKIGI